MIKYCCEWEKDKANTWSGTPYHLLKALKREMDVEDNGFFINKYRKKILKIINIKITNTGIVKKRLYNPHLEKINQKKIDCIKANKDDKIFQIFDLGISKNKYYIYQDLNIDYLMTLKKTDIDAFRYSGFEKYPDEDFVLRKKTQDRIYEDAEGIFTMSQFLADHLVEYSKIPESKVHCVGAGINVNINNIKNYSKNNNRILFVGRDFYRKGGDIVVEAFNIIRNKYNKNIELYIAGPDINTISKYNEDGIYLLGNLSYDKLSYYFNICDIFCMPSRFEAYGIAFIEALCYGLPCIGRNKFAMKEIINNNYNGYLIENDNSEILALKIMDLLENEKIKNNVKKEYSNYIEKYSWDSVAKKIKNVLNKC